MSPETIKKGQLDFDDSSRLPALGATKSRIAISPPQRTPGILRAPSMGLAEKAAHLAWNMALMKALPPMATPSVTSAPLDEAFSLSTNDAA